MGKKTIGYDETKRMLNVLRNLNEENLYNTQQTAPETKNQLSDVLVINDVEVKLISSDKADMEITEEQKQAISQLIDNFRQQVSQIVDFDPGLTLDEKQIRLDGNLPDEDFGFVFVAGDESGLYINADMTKLEEDVKVVFEKLMKFEEVFKTAMSPLITQRSNN